MVQRILGSMDSDEVSTISQTPDALEVANIIKECYFDIVSKMDLPEHKGIYQLDASTDSTKPVLMNLPSNALDAYSVKYNNTTVDDPVWYDVQFLVFSDFLEIVNTYDTTSTNVSTMELTINGGDFTFKFLTDRVPTYCTSFDDRSIIFDSYDSGTESTLQKVKTFCYGGILPTFTMSDTYVPDLDPRQFQLLLQDAKAQSFVEQKQTPNPTAERKARKNEILAQRTKNAVDQRTALEKGRHYGRK